MTARPTGRRPSQSRRGIVAAVAVALLAPVVVWSALREDNAIMSPNATTMTAIRATIARQGGDPGSMTGAARALARAEPMSVAPFVITALVANAEGQYDRARLLLEEAVRRRPSLVLARVLLAVLYARAGRGDAAVASADIALRVDGRQRPLLFPLLVAELDDPSGQGVLIAALERYPFWRNDFMIHAIDHGARRDVLLAILSRPVPPDQLEATEIHRGRLIRAMLAEGNAERAYLTWLSLLPPAALPLVRPVYDGDFAGHVGPEPFNWTLTNGDRLSTIPARDGKATYLDVRYAADVSYTVAEQTVFLAPGRYRLSMQLRGERMPTSGTFRWQFDCATGERRPLVVIAFETDSARWTVLRREIVVPDGCAAQRLALTAWPSGTGEPASLQLRGIQLAKIGE